MTPAIRSATKGNPLHFRAISFPTSNSSSGQLSFSNALFSNNSQLSSGIKNRRSRGSVWNFPCKDTFFSRVINIILLPFSTSGKVLVNSSHVTVSHKLETRDCPFGDKALLANDAKLETMRSLWMSNCSVSFEPCKLLAQKLPGLNVEVIDERGHPDTRPESCPVEKLYIYRTVSGRRFDTPGFVWIIDEDAALTPYSNGNCSLASS